MSTGGEINLLLLPATSYFYFSEWIETEENKKYQRASQVLFCDTFIYIFFEEY